MKSEFLARSPLLALPLLALFFFVVVFLVVLVLTMRRKAGSYDEIARLPLEGGSSTDESSNGEPS